MSSNYHVLCVSHDPAIAIDHDFRSALDALNAAAEPGGHEQLRDHLRCDLVVGRYSYPLIEAVCPGVKPHCPNYHRYDSGTPAEAGWLRLLYAAHTRGDDVGWMRLPACWTKQRVIRLAHELGIVTTPTETP